MKTRKTGRPFSSFRGRKTGKRLTLLHLLVYNAFCRRIPNVHVSAGQDYHRGCVFDRAFEDVLVSWRATFNLTAPALISQGVNLTKELQQTSGRVLCRTGQVLCLLHLEVRPDQVQRHEKWMNAVWEMNTSRLVISPSLSCIRFLWCLVISSTACQASFRVSSTHPVPLTRTALERNSKNVIVS